jgi:hypothetical protein
MIGMLIFYAAWCKNCGRLNAPDYLRQLYGMFDMHFQMRISVKFYKLDTGSKYRSRLLGLSSALVGAAIACRFTAGANHKMRLASATCFFENCGTTAELNVVGMRAESE